MIKKLSKLFIKNREFRYLNEGLINVKYGNFCDGYFYKANYWVHGIKFENWINKYPIILEYK